MVFLAAVGIILTPIYLLSMLRQVFYGSDVAPTCGITDASLQNQDNEEAVCFGTNCVLPSEAKFSDARPREVFIAVCFLLLTIGIGVYPKLATEIYDVKTVAVNTQVRQSYIQISQTNPQVFAKGLLFPRSTQSNIALVSGIDK